VHCGMIESITSVGAALVAMPRGQAVVGVENHTSFLRAARVGRLRATARPLSAGRTSQVWEGEVRDDEGRLLATGRVRVLCMDEGSHLAGGKASRTDR
jgi:1,4-dihydroxy-2-naphthoyl-CoA hydrolase